MNKKQARMMVTIPDDVHKKLKALAELEGKTMQEIALEAINTRLKKAEKKSNKKKVITKEDIRKIGKEIMEEYRPVFEKLAKT